MENIRELIATLEKLITAEQDWHDATYQQSKDMNFHQNFSDSEVHDVILKAIEYKRNLEKDKLSKIKEGLCVLKEFYDATSGYHAERAHLLFSIESEKLKKGVDIQIMYAPTDKTSRAEEIYKKSLQIGKVLAQKLSKEQINALFSNSELDEASALDLNEKLKQEIKEYTDRNNAQPPYADQLKLEKISPEYPLISMLKRYAIFIKLSGDDSGEHDRLHLFNALTDQIARILSEKCLSRYYLENKEVSVTCLDKKSDRCKKIHTNILAPENVCV